MEKMTAKMHQARRIAKKRETEESNKRIERMRREATNQGYQRGAAQVRELERMMAHPIAQEMLSHAGREMGRLVAEKAEEAGTPGVIALRCANEVWSYVQKTGAPIEQVVRMVVEYHMEHMETRMRFNVPEMFFENRVDDRELTMMRGY